MKIEECSRVQGQALARLQFLGPVLKADLYKIDWIHSDISFQEI